MGKFLRTLLACICILVLLALCAGLVYLIYDLIVNVYVEKTPASEYFGKWTENINIPGLESPQEPLSETPQGNENQLMGDFPALPNPQS